MHYTMKCKSSDDIQITMTPEVYPASDWDVIATGAAPPGLGAEIINSEWVIPIELRRSLVWEAVKVLRADKGLLATTPFGVVQADDVAKVNVSGLVQMAMIAKGAGAPFNEPFTLADNSVVTLTADQTIGLGVAVGRHVSAVYARARALRGEIAASSDPDSIDIQSGWL